MKTNLKNSREAGLTLIVALISIFIFGIVMAVSMRLITDQNRATSSLTNRSGRVQVIKNLSKMDCCMTLNNLMSGVIGGASAVVGLTCDQINSQISSLYGDAEKNSIIPLRPAGPSNSSGMELGGSQVALNPDIPGRDRGRYIGKWNYAIRCASIGSDTATSAKYLKITTWRGSQMKDKLTNEDLSTPEEFIKVKACAGYLNGSKTC